ncbi:MAG: hypothetical protein Q8K63_04575 [Acidimicrobiales bacterium]|nr:hypothetical protein [Acidimicrobiales bacterium]
MRDLWLADAVLELRPLFTGAGLAVPIVAIKTGSAAIGSRRDSTAIALCTCAPGLSPCVTVSDTLTDPIAILGTIVHEMIHAADRGQSRHGVWFAGWATRLGLEGPPEATIPGRRLVRTLRAMADRLGPYPRAGARYVVYGDWVRA